MKRTRILVLACYALPLACILGFLVYRMVKPRDEIKIHGTEIVRHDPLPADVSFRSIFEGNDGLRVEFVPDRPSLLTARKGEHGQLYPGYGDRRVLAGNLTPGPKKGMLVLKASLSNAAHDPRIKAVWGGTLRFPHAFTVLERNERGGFSPKRETDISPKKKNAKRAE